MLDAIESPVPWLRHHPSCWRKGTLDLPGLRSAADALRAQPGFASAVRHFATRWQAAYDASPVLTTVMRDNARYAMLVACLWMDHVRDPLHPADCITSSRLITFYGRVGCDLVTASPSRVKAMLGHARARGLLQSAPGPGDARRRPLEPTAALRDAMAGWVAGFLHGIGTLLPLPVTPEAMVARPGFIGELFTYRVTALLEDRFSINQGLPAIRWITDHEKGYHLFLSLMRGLQLQPDGTALTTAIPQALADHAGVSRSTARNFLQACMRQGWIAPGPGHGLVLKPAFVDEALHWMGLEFVWMHALALAAWHRLAGVNDLIDPSPCEKLTGARHVDPTLAMVHSIRLTGLN